MFKSDYNHYNRREAVYEMNLPKAYVLFWGKCSKGMQNKIKARPDFKSDIMDNLFNLPKAIKEHSTSYQENCYNMSMILDAMYSSGHKADKRGNSTRLHKMFQDCKRGPRISYWKANNSNQVCESHPRIH